MSKLQGAPKTFLSNRGEQVLEIGMSGTRKGMTQIQKEIFRYILAGRTGVFHHGDCVGADAECHNIIRTYYPDKWRIIIHPPTKSELRAFCKGEIVYTPKPYLDRNRDIVDACNVFFAFPKDHNRVGGTWYTIEYFRKVLELEFGTPYNPRVGQIIMPNGDVGNILVESKLGAKLSTQ